MVGIHARTAREKIAEGKIAHVMNDEETRKYIQAVKVREPTKKECVGNEIITHG